MASDVQIWRYSIPPLNGQGWGIFILDSTGMFAAVTDYGNCAFKWTHHGCNDFREFLAKVKPCRLNDYCIIKLFGSKNVFDSDETLKEIKRHILTYRYEDEYSKDFARKEWGLLEDYYDESEFGFGRWLEETSISDAYEFAVYDYSAGAKMFGSELLPRLAEVLREELQKEAVA